MTALAQKIGIVLVSAGLLGLVTWADHASGNQVNCLVFYALPIAWVAWSVDLSWAVAIIVLSTWARVHLDAGVHHFAYPWIAWERASMRVVMLTFIAFSFHQFRRDLDRKNRKVRDLEGILPVCIACNRISDREGRWTDLDTYLRRHSEAQPEPRLCPDCAGLRNK
jgi:hypothetical protein